jgi:hypothetical protein
MVSRKFLILSLMVILLAACSKPATPVVGVDTDFATACNKSNDGKRIALAGFLRLPDSFSGDQSVVLRLYETNDFTSQPIGVQAEFGTQANQVEPISTQYTDNDLKVHLSDGQLVQFGTKVKVSGTVYFPIVAQEFACSLENPLVELAP